MMEYACLLLYLPFNYPYIFVLYSKDEFCCKKQRCLCFLYLSEEGIDEESFNLLDEATIIHLIPRAGPRLKFLKKFRELVRSMT